MLCTDAKASNTMSETTREPIDELFVALANVQRRRILIGLLEHDPRSARARPDVSGVHAMSDDEAIASYHVHLPKLEEFGLVEWDREAGELLKGPEFETIEPVLECLCDQRRDFSEILV